jgi:hypothetical protein
MKNLKARQIFLLDGIGAIFSVLCLFVFYTFEELVGMPKRILIIFIFIALIFSVCSFTCYSFNPINSKRYFTIIAILNIAYCIFTAYQVIIHSNRLTVLGHLYFIVEILVILLLVFYELKLSKT